MVEEVPIGRNKCRGGIMEDPATFEQALELYKSTYVQVGLDQQPPNALDEPRSKILQSLARLEDLVNAESEEIKSFPENAVASRDTTRALVSESLDLKTQRKSASDELQRINHIMGEAPLPVNWSPIYIRLGVIGGLLVTIALMRSTRVVV